MRVSDFLKERNYKIVQRYRELKATMSSSEAKKIISSEFSNLSVATINQVIYNKKYSNSPFSSGEK